MKQNEYTCAMIADLIPLCAESLCSPESRAAVEAHIESCEHCRKLYEALPEEAEPAAVRYFISSATLVWFLPLGL